MCPPQMGVMNGNRARDLAWHTQDSLPHKEADVVVPACSRSHVGEAEVGG
jgi:hypothetical protein